jgi:hypothetical protein
MVGLTPGSHTMPERTSRKRYPGPNLKAVTGRMRDAGTQEQQRACFQTAFRLALLAQVISPREGHFVAPAIHLSRGHAQRSDHRCRGPYE